MIQPINNTQPSFGKYALIQIPHKAFKNPKDYIAVEKEFIKICNKSVNMPSDWKCKIAKFFGRAICPKIDAFLESPYYSETIDSLQKMGNYSIEWARMHTGADINSPLKEGYHYFVVLTNEDFDVMAESYLNEEKKEERDIFISERIKQYIAKGLHYNDLINCAMVNEIANKDFNEVFESKNPEKYEIKNLSELPAIIKSIMK